MSEKSIVPALSMPQLQMPIFSGGVHLITPNLGYRRDGDDIVYLHGVIPFFFITAITRPLSK